MVMDPISQEIIDMEQFLEQLHRKIVMVGKTMECILTDPTIES